LLKGNGFQIPETKDGLETFIELNGTIVDDKTITFLTWVVTLARLDIRRSDVQAMQVTE
jgi:hypothetical protein